MNEVIFQNAINTFDDSDKLTEKIYSLIPNEWEVINENPWLMAIPNHNIPVQGWKGHTSSLLWDAIEVAKIAIPILVRKNCAFKIVKNFKLVEIINGIHYPMSGANKFITFYPQNEDVFKDCVYELYEALKHLKGPRIHTDFQCGLNGVVHFRYGAFKKMTKYDFAKNRVIHCMKNDDGELVEDARNPWYEKPEWVKEPFDDMDIFKNTLELKQEDAEKINKYKFISILSRANKGNVYLAEIKECKKEVVIKESNPYVSFGEKASDAQQVLKNEYEVLEKMNKYGCVPQIYEMFNCENKSYIVEEKIDGQTMTHYALLNKDNFYEDKVKLANELVRIVNLFHENGYILRDLKTDNIMITRDMKLKFIDLETVCSIDLDKDIYMVGTQGFFNPEFVSKKIDTLNDWYATIVNILTLMMGSIPYFSRDLTKGVAGVRSVMAKVVNYVQLLSYSGRLKEEEHNIIIDIINNRMGNDYNGLVLEGRKAVESISVPYIVDNTIEGLYRECERNIKNNAKRLWKSTEFGETTLILNIQHGVAGVGEFLIRYLEENNRDNEIAEKTLSTITEYIKGNIEEFIVNIKNEDNEDSFLFGRFGASWFLNDLGEYLNDEEFIKYSKILADVDTGDDCLDFALGEAGRTYNDLKLWISTRNRKYYDRAVKRAHYIINESEELKAVKNRHIEKVSNYGFAHGYAGIAYVIYMVGVMDNNNNYKDYALKKVKNILDIYENILEGDQSKISISWCNGLAGISLALVRINQFEKNERVTKFLNRIPEILVNKMWYQSPCQCHGNASSIEFLMDAYSITGDDLYYDAAKKIANFVTQQLFFGKNGVVCFPNETKVFDVYDFGVGTIGTIQVLNRVYKKSKNRLFMIDDTKLLN